MRRTNHFQSFLKISSSYVELKFVLNLESLKLKSLTLAHSRIWWCFFWMVWERTKRTQNINISDAASYNSEIISPKNTESSRVENKKRIKNRSRDKKNMKNTLRFRFSFLICELLTLTPKHVEIFWLLLTSAQRFLPLPFKLITSPQLYGEEISRSIEINENKNEHEN